MAQTLIIIVTELNEDFFMILQKWLIDILYNYKL